MNACADRSQVDRFAGRFEQGTGASYLGSAASLGQMMSDAIVRTQFNDAELCCAPHFATPRYCEEIPPELLAERDKLRIHLEQFHTIRFPRLSYNMDRC